MPMLAVGMFSRRFSCSRKHEHGTQNFFKPRHLALNTNKRILLIAVASLVMFALVGAAAAALFWPRLPDPAGADRAGLFRWLVTCDMSQQPEQTQLTLASRLEEELVSSPELGDSVQSLDERQRATVWDNIMVLMRPWFMQKVDRYSLLQKPDRTDFVNQFLDTVAALRGLESLAPAPAATDGDAKSKSDLFSVLLAQVDKWKADVGSRQAEQIDQFLKAVKIRWLARSLRG
jgi:hypothetical protein